MNVSAGYTLRFREKDGMFQVLRVEETDEHGAWSGRCPVETKGDLLGLPAD